MRSSITQQVLPKAESLESQNSLSNYTLNLILPSFRSPLFVAQESRFNFGRCPPSSYDVFTSEFKQMVCKVVFQVIYRNIISPCFDDDRHSMLSRTEDNLRLRSKVTKHVFSECPRKTLSSSQNLLRNGKSQGFCTEVRGDSATKFRRSSPGY